MTGIPPDGCRGTTIRCTGIGRCPGSGWKKANSTGPRQFDITRHVKTTILHGQDDIVISPDGSRRFADELRRRDPSFPLDLQLIPGDHRLSSPEHLELFHRLVERRD